MRSAPNLCGHLLRSSPEFQTATSAAIQMLDCRTKWGSMYLTPQKMSAIMAEFVTEGWINIVGGCCGTTPDHIREFAQLAEEADPRQRVAVTPLTRLSGTQPLTIRPETNFIMIGERTNVTGSRKFARLIRNDLFDEAVEVARQQVLNGASIIDINMDDALLDAEASMTKYLNLIAGEADINTVPVMIDSSKWTVLRSRLEMPSGKRHCEFHQPERWRRGVPQSGQIDTFNMVLLRSSWLSMNMVRRSRRSTRWTSANERIVC